MKIAQRIALGYIRVRLRLLSSISKRKAAEKAFALFCTPQYRNRKKLPRIFEEAEKLQFIFEGHKVRGYRWNHPSEKKLLILHGFESSVINFDRYVKPLVSNGFEVLAFDAIAHGRSGGKQITAPLYKKMILEINKRFGPIRNFFAHSFGGLVVSLALEEMEHDEQFKLVLIAPATETTTAVASFFSFLKLDDELRTEFDRVILNKGGQETAWYSISRAMQHIKARVLWFHDEVDDTTPLTDVMKVKQKNFRNISFVITSGLGHRRIYRENKVVKQAIAFFSGQSAD